MKIPTIAIDPAREPAAIVTNPPYGITTIGLRDRRFTVSPLELLREQQMQPYQAEIDDRLSGLNRLARARRLIQKGGNRPMKRARRLYRLVYGPQHYRARFQMAASFIRAEQIFRGLARSIAASTISAQRFSDVIRAASQRRLVTPLTREEMDRMDG